MSFKVIQTKYKNHLFRSRQEARWATCFDALGIPWRYEYEGFQLNGYRYLPDFLLPAQALWVEVKGKPPTEQEFAKATLLAQHDRNNAVLITWENFSRDTCEDNVIMWTDENGVFHSKRGWRWLENPEEGWAAARVARFEKPRRGLPWLEWGKPQYGKLPY